ncbi:hypothetical protein MMC20_004315 [Loxospora ochrophaea]|nr:hypothetical protein [Loxospora ochrophaea]
MDALLGKRQFDEDCDFDDDDCGFYSQKSLIIRYSVFGGIVLIFVLVILGGYFHARRRMKKGLPPWRAHKVFLPSSQRHQGGPQNQFSYYQTRGDYNQEYGMQSLELPAYNSDNVPPTYQPPDGASKIYPTQDWAAIPPAGSPPNREPVSADGRDTESQLPSRPPQSRWISRINPFKR